MSTDVDAESTVSVSTRHTVIEKTFESEEFAVPAITFEITSQSDDAVAIRLVDYIPTDFPMDSVGFHPDFENTNWTAYKDHRVQFERVLEPGESLVTVYGIRLGNLDEVSSFLGQPEVYEVDLEDIEADLPFENEPKDPADEQVDDGSLIDIVDEDSNQVVRDVISGENESIPGLESDGTENADSDPLAAEDADPLGVEADTDPLAESDADPLGDLDGSAVEESSAEDAAEGPESFDEPDFDPLPDDGEAPVEEESTPDGDAAESPDGSVDGAGPTGPLDPLGDADADPESEPEPADLDEHEQAPVEELIDEPAADETEEADEAVEELAAEESVAGEGEEADEAPAAPAVESIGAALAAEIREGRVSDADLRILRHELDFQQPESTNVRIRHLQSRVDDLEAYTEALEAFIDDNGTAEQLLSDYEDEVESLRGRVGDVESELGGVDVSAGFEDVDQRFEELEELVGANTTDATALAGEVESLGAELESEIDSLGDHLDSVDEELSETVAEFDEVADRLDSVDDLDERFDSLESDVAALREEIGEIQEWRSQLSSVFGPQDGS